MSHFTPSAAFGLAVDVDMEAWLGDEIMPAITLRADQISHFDPPDPLHASQGPA
jgi:hypothetical protein